MSKNNGLNFKYGSRDLSSSQAGQLYFTNVLEKWSYLDMGTQYVFAWVGGGQQYDHTVAGKVRFFF